MKSLEKIDKFFVVWILALISLGGLMLFTFRTVFTSFVTAYEVENEKGVQVKIDKESLNGAYEFVFEREEPPLNVTQ
jgi:hypothetical protein